MSRHDAYVLAWLLYWTVLLVLHCFNGCAHPPAPSSTHGTPQPTHSAVRDPFRAGAQLSLAEPEGGLPRP
jgi:hypothetical protein